MGVKRGLKGEGENSFSASWTCRAWQVCVRETMQPDECDVRIVERISKYGRAFHFGTKGSKGRAWCL